MPTVEERLAALETKLAALTATTPTEYYTHQYSGEEIDAAVGRAVSGGALDTSVTNVSNQLGTFVRPNLLDNWYFGRPVNQRGQTSYSADWIYTIDRWQTSENSTLTVNNGSVSLTGSYIFEPLEEIVDALKGKTVTVSLLFSTGELEFATGVVPTTWSGWSSIVKNSHVGLQGIGEDSSRLWLLITDSAKNILAVKLELGPTQTLAHREGDRWVLNEVPEYGEQLRRCQRYYFTSNGLIGTSGCLTGGKGTINVDISLPVSMRTKPSIVGTPTVTGVRTVPNGTNSIASITGAAVIGSSDYNSAVSLALSTSTFNTDAFINNTPIYCYVSNLMLSADL